MVNETFQLTGGSSTHDVRRYAARAYDDRVKVVCSDCNNGWMNDLENEAEPVLTPLMRGESVDFNLAERAVLARWAGKTALIRLQLTPMKSHTAEATRLAHFAVYSGHPPNWGWLFAAPAERTPLGAWTRSTLVAMFTMEPPPPVLITTLHMERLLLVSVLPLTDEAGAAANNILANWAVRNMTPIYPSRRKIRWSQLAPVSAMMAKAAGEPYIQLLQKPDPGSIPPAAPGLELQEE